MHDTDERLASFRAETARARTVEELHVAYGTFVRVFGFDAYAVGFVPGQPGDLDDPFMFINWPRTWLELYAREGFASEDAVVAAAHVATEPFTWAELQQRQPGASERIFAAARTFGWTDGLLVPVRVRVSNQLRLGVASLAAPTLSALTASGRRAVAEASTLAFKTGIQLRAKIRRSLLTRRENEALSLVAAGLGDREIATRMGVTSTTAHFHVEQAKRKLGAGSRAQAAALAVSRGLITL